MFAYIWWLPSTFGSPHEIRDVATDGLREPFTKLKTRGESDTNLTSNISRGFTLEGL